MHFLDAKTIHAFAICSRRFYADADTDFAWRHATYDFRLPPFPRLDDTFWPPRPPEPELQQFKIELDARRPLGIGTRIPSMFESTAQPIGIHRAVRWSSILYLQSPIVES